ncbi:unnamed protein product [Adineta ricciae]|uniref:EGF-like domain-containing protein n=1 Tax=Adineta ricciae TaxID=249248 RepID=A0A815JTV5_ADIRI|nr:unnamed protein product [Adineta ricciae]
MLSTCSNFYYLPFNRSEQDANVRITKLSLRESLEKSDIVSQSTKQHSGASCTRFISQKIYPNTYVRPAEDALAHSPPDKNGQNDLSSFSIKQTTPYNFASLLPSGISCVTHPIVGIKKNKASSRSYTNKENRIQSFDDHRKRKKRQKRCCCSCTPLCTFLSTMGGIFLAVLLAGILVKILSRKDTNIKTTTTTSTASTTNTTAICSPPCLNGGTCVLSNNTCLCISDVWTGSQCQTPMRIFWAFDNNLLDLYGNFPGSGKNNPTYQSPGITGYGSCLYLNGSLNQSVTVYEPPFLNMAYTSFSLTVWARANSFRTGCGIGICDNAIFGQHDQNTVRRSLHITVRYQTIYLGFYGDDISGSLVLQPLVWYHMAFVYDYQNREQLVYVNGDLDNSGSLKGPYEGISGDLTIGTNGVGSPNFWDGCLDQITYFSRAKSAAEVLRDATLTVSYTFNNNTLDDGPLGINGTGINVQYSPFGRVNQSLKLSNSSSFVEARGLVYLGTNGYSYSIVIWIRPTSVAGGTIVHVSPTSGTITWSMPMLGFTNAGNIGVQSCSSSGVVSLIGPLISTGVWTHVAITYSSLNGLRLWINGTLFNTSSPNFVWSTINAPVTITLGASPSNVGACASGVITTGQYSDLLDEFQLYSRELLAAEVMNLATP